MVQDEERLENPWDENPPLLQRIKAKYDPTKFSTRCHGRTTL